MAKVTKKFEFDLPVYGRKFNSTTLKEEAYKIYTLRIEGNASDYTQPEGEPDYEYDASLFKLNYRRNMVNVTEMVLHLSGVENLNEIPFIHNAIMNHCNTLFAGILEEQAA